MINIYALRHHTLGPPAQQPTMQMFAAKKQVVAFKKHQWLLSRKCNLDKSKGNIVFNQIKWKHRLNCLEWILQTFLSVALVFLQPQLYASSSTSLKDQFTFSRSRLNKWSSQSSGLIMSDCPQTVPNVPPLTHNSTSKQAFDLSSFDLSSLFDLATCLQPESTFQLEHVVLTSDQVRVIITFKLGFPRDSLESIRQRVGGASLPVTLARWPQ